jgi:hypothetical protein
VEPGVGDEQVAEHLGPHRDGFGAGELPAAPRPEPDERRRQPADEPGSDGGNQPPGPPPGQGGAGERETGPREHRVHAGPPPARRHRRADEQPEPTGDRHHDAEAGCRADQRTSERRRAHVHQPASFSKR